LTSFDIIEKVKDIRKQHNLEERGLAESNVRRQLKRLRDLMLVDKKSNLYRLSEFESLSHLFANKIEGFLIPQTVERVKEYLSHIDNAQ
jgi:predicted transcriptional regulator